MPHRFRHRNIIAILSIVAGVLILLSPSILAYMVAIYLIVSGILQLME